MATIVRDLVTVVLVLHFAPRPEDLFSWVLFDSAVHPELKERLDKSIFKGLFGDWIVRFRPSKTYRIDKIRYASEGAPIVNFVFPPRWNFLLEKYLEGYRILIDPLSPVLLPSNLKGRADHPLFLRGARADSVASRAIIVLAEKYCGRKLNEDGFRSILQTYLVTCGLQGEEGRLVGHNSVAHLSEVARKHYYRPAEFDLHKIAKRFYQTFFEELEAGKKILAGTNGQIPKTAKIS